jgi:anaerobic magnesium-protoporphyrin IX monomethyl ester cyclase
MTTDILFGQSYYLRFDPKLWAAQQPYPPLGTLYAAAVMRRAGYDVALFDAMLAQSEAEWDAALARHRPRFAVIYEDNFNYLSKMCLLRMREAAFTMAGMARARGCVVIAAGSDAGDHHAAYLRAGADYVLIGEGEETLAELIDHLTGRAGGQLQHIQGLAYTRDGQPHLTAPRPVIRDVDSLPLPAWDLVDIERYRAAWSGRHGYYSMNMATTRGCPYHCNWCAKPIWGQRYHSRAPETVAAEIRLLRDTYAPDHIWFVDDIMGLMPGWWARFADAVAAQEARLPFKCLSRADLLLRGDDVTHLARAGADIVWMGAESGSQRVLDAMEKGTTVEQIYEATRRLRSAGVRVGFFLQFGYPGETREDIERTLQMVRDCRPDDIGMSVSYPLPGTKFYDSVRQQLSDKRNWVDSADLDMLYEGPFSTAFYRQLYAALHKEFRARRAWGELRRVAAHPTTWRPGHAREAAATLYRLATLPVDRRRLDRLAAKPSRPVAPPPAMSPAEAARPTPQSPNLQSPSLPISPSLNLPISRSPSSSHD